MEFICEIYLGMAPDGMIHTERFMNIGSGIHVTWRVLPQQLERLQYFYYWWEGFMIYAVEMASDGMKYLSGFMTIDSGIQVILRLLPKEH
jgi:hypothetical protein